MARRQTLVQLSDELLAALDAAAVRERRSRSQLIRDAVERYLDGNPEAVADRRLVEGYTQTPPAEFGYAEWSARQMLAEEPWPR